MAAKTARIKSADMLLMMISGPGNITAFVRAARVTKSPAVIDSTAIKDEYRFNQPGIKDFDLIVTNVIETSGKFHAIVDSGSAVTFTADLGAGDSQLLGWAHCFDYETGVEVDGVQTEAVRLSVHKDTL